MIATSAEPHTSAVRMKPFPSTSERAPQQPALAREIGRALAHPAEQQAALDQDERGHRGQERHRDRGAWRAGEARKAWAVICRPDEDQDRRHRRLGQEPHQHRDDA